MCNRPGSVVQGFVPCNRDLFSKLLPDSIESVEFVQGDRDAVGCVRALKEVVAVEAQNLEQPSCGGCAFDLRVVYGGYHSWLD
ncbi:hypothetical protein Nepgr_032723 [Nepenthes gracilis]|uniref:Uncharacterized protein n=1 Tax=Nepenthes gracilis TaxID=150966 RepID=A0AAD3TJX0_NEPGR|nr:hypothetical protein Nepgr_032723 [Nepenthes gracilis]